MKQILITSMIVSLMIVGCDLDENKDPDSDIEVGEALVINEFLASNTTTIADDSSEYDDWIELFNGTNAEIDIGGMYVSDDLADPEKCLIPGDAPDLTTIPSGGFLIIWFDKDPEQGTLHIDTKLSASAGEDIVLTDENGNVLDSYTFGPQVEDVSEGRLPDGAVDNWRTFDTPTPGASNN